MNTTISTKFGNIRLNNGYYCISSKKENNWGKLFHRLLFEDFYGSIPNGFVVHHKDGNKLNNCILNLQLMRKTEHDKLHNTGENNHKYWKGKHLSEEAKRKLSLSKQGQNNPNYGKHHSKSTLNKMSNALNTTGYFRVMKIKKDGVKQGFTWLYAYYDENGKRHRITSVDLDKLKEKVLVKGLEWYKLSEVNNAS